jgi:hypothetical protein
MMTRASVAKRLGKSIATVQRLEGRELFPSVDERGVHRFRESDVEHISSLLRAGYRLPAAKGDWLSGARYVRKAHPTAAQGEPIEHQLLAAKLEVIATIRELSGEGFEHLDPDVLDYFDDLLEEAQLATR